MPQRRRIQKGSFGSHFDELMRQFPHREPDGQNKPAELDEPSTEDGSARDRLFESAWRKPPVTR